MPTDVPVIGEVAELEMICGTVEEFQAEGRRLLFLEKVTLPIGCSPPTLEGLLCPQERDGYATRLFLSAPVIGKGTNWTRHRILDREWHTWSWKDVRANQRLSQILGGHLQGLR
jgi:hypothetical protein